MLKLKLQYSGHLMARADSLEKTSMLGKIEDRRKRGLQRVNALKTVCPHLGKIVQFSSVALSCPTLWDPMDCSTPDFPVHHQLPELIHLCPSSQWCHPTISSSCLQSFPASGSLSVSQFFTSSGQRIGVSASASVLPINIQDWFPSGLTSWISLQSKGLSNLLQHHSPNHQFFGAQLSL